MKILYLLHKTVRNYKNHFFDEINLFGQHILSKDIPYEFDYKEFDDELEWQSYNQGQIKALSIDFMKRICGREFNPGDYSVVFFCFQPTEQGSAGVFTSYGTFDCNGAIVSCIPITLQDAQRQDQWLWRAFYHEFIHCCFGILKVNWKVNIVDIQDSAYQEYRKSHSNPTEDELTALSDNIFDIHLKPYLSKLLAEPPQKGLANMLFKLIGLLTTMISLLQLKQSKKSVIDRLANCIATREGFYLEGSLPNRLNNPGAMKWSPFMTEQREGFAYFETPELGWKALKYQLKLIFEGESIYYKPTDSILKFVSTWASTSPKEEIENYAKYIADMFGVNVFTKLNELR